MMRHRCLALVFAALAARVGSARAQVTRFQGFTDIVASRSGLPGSHSAFGLGQVDLFVTSKLADRISFLGETVLEFDGGFIVDVERIVVTFAPTHFFRVAVGKHHTPIGYWNNAYHHGALLQPTIHRPSMVLFEDEGGVLPIHTVGVLVSGRQISPLRLGYDVMVGNGIGSTPTQDNDDAKSLTIAMHSQVTSALRVGASAYVDRIAAGTVGLDGTPLAESVDARLLGGFLAYLGPRLEWIGEYQHATHRVRRSGTTTGTDALFIYGGYRLGKVVPYLRYDALRYPATDPYFVTDDVRQGLVGTRYDIAPGTVVKVEINRKKPAGRPAVTGLTAQVAVGF